MAAADGMGVATALGRLLLSLADRLSAEPCSACRRPAWEAWRTAYWLAGGAGPARAAVCQPCLEAGAKWIKQEAPAVVAEAKQEEI